MRLTAVGVNNDMKSLCGYLAQNTAQIRVGRNKSAQFRHLRIMPELRRLVPAYV
jgi:hypothetical protein